MKTIAVVLTLAISGIAISAAYTEAYASRMNGRMTWAAQQREGKIRHRKVQGAYGQA
jgi:hypothetical protein